MRRITSNKFCNLQVSNGLEILSSMGKRLTLNIRSESAYEIGEVLKGFTKRPSGRVSFSFYPRIFRSAEIRQEIPYPGILSHQTGSVPQALCQLSTPVSESGIRPLTATPWKGSGIFFRRCASPLPASRGSFRPVAIGVLFIPLPPWIRVLAMTEELWLIHVTEPVTETIS